jgi:hypothetical protein
MGQLRERRRITIPLVAAIGGMAVPVLIYLAFNAGGEGLGSRHVDRHRLRARRARAGGFGRHTPARLPA